MGHIVLYNIYKTHLTEYIKTVLLLVNSFKFTLKEIQSEPKYVHKQNISRRYQQIILIDLSWRLSEKNSLDSVC